MRNRSEGFTLIELLIVIAVIAILAALAIPNLLSSRKAANETAAIAQLKTISSAQETYKIRGMGTGGVYATLSALQTSGLVLWPSTTGFVKSGYTFADILATPDTVQWGVSAVPNQGAGDRTFCVTMDNFVRGQTGTTPPADIATAQGSGWLPVQ
ncbi:MAG: prepilin-type N-terminal cleavage/methylation domain-containing protein [Armatimonadetes bacterium]|nr:prepilin-type N-terminal cleavage/methylation domain-containing protein [Armatimonadota bacterium]